MYASAPGVRLRCRYICASCLNTTIRIRENVGPCLLRQYSTRKETAQKSHDEPTKSTSAIPDSLSLWLNRLATQDSKVAPEDNTDQNGDLPKRPTSSKGQDDTDKKGQVSADKSAIGKKGPKKPMGAKKTTRQELTADKKQSTKTKPASPVAEKPSSEENSPSSPPGNKLKRRKKNKEGKSRVTRFVKSKSPSPVDKVVRYLASKSIPRTRARSIRHARLVNTTVTPHGTSTTSKRPTRRRGSLLTKLYAVTSASANRIAKKVLLDVLKKQNLLNSRGLQAAQEGEDIFKNAAQKELERVDKTLSETLLGAYNSLDSALKERAPKEKDSALGPLKTTASSSTGIVCGQELKLVPIEKPQPPVPGLVCGLERVLFNHGVYQLRDAHSRVYNFDPYLESITPVKEFDYESLQEYITSSRDKTFIETAAAEGSKYTGSTSSMSSALAHFHFLLSKWRPVNLSQLSRGFPQPLTSFTVFQRAPAGIFLRRRDGVYAIDASKEFDTSNVLMWLGKSMEKFLTLEKEEYIKYRKEHSHSLTDDDKNRPESYHYTTFGDFLMRSQLDAYDPRLPGTGMYDLKTRAVVSIRKDAKDYEDGLGYEITSRKGEWNSYEREYYDMCRAAFLKYSLQVRMGRMDGIFVAFHNTERIFGFQYLPLSEMDEALHGTTNTTLGDTEFKISLELLNQVLNNATEKFPDESLQIQFETRPKNASNGDCFMYIIVRPVAEEDIQAIQDTNLKQIQEYEKRVIGLHGDEKAAAITAAIEDAAKAVEAGDHDERLADAFGNLDEPASVETIRKASDPVEKGTTVTEKAVDKMLDLVSARIESEDIEVEASGSNEPPIKTPDGEAEISLGSDVPAPDATDTSEAKTVVGPLAVFKLNIRNFVNGREVLRPGSLKPTDDWKVKYSIEDMGSQANEIYKGSMARKKKVSTGAAFLGVKGGSFGEDIKSSVREGKEHRKEMNRLDRVHGVKVYDKQEFLNFKSLEKREEAVRKEVDDEIKELETLKRANKHAAKV